MKKVILTDIDGVLVDWRGKIFDFMVDQYKDSLDQEKLKNQLNGEEYCHFSDLVGNYGDPAEICDSYINSFHLKQLPCYEDAKTVINELKNDYTFIGVTALGTTEQIKKNRQDNLELHFPNVFKHVFYVNPYESKAPHIKQLTDLYGDKIVCFVDDLIYNLNDSYYANSNIKQFYLNRTNENEKPNVPHIEVKNWFHIKEKLLK